MRPRIINILILSVFTINLYGIPPEELEQQLLQLEQKVFLCKSDSEKAGFCFQKMQLYIAAGNYSAAPLQEAKRVDYTLIKDSTLQKQYLWNAALIAYLNHDFNFSTHYYGSYQKLHSDSSIEAMLLGIMINGSMDSISLNAPIAYLSHVDSSFNSLQCLKEAAAYNLKNEKFFTIASAIVPGSGTMMNGEIIKGTSSLLLTGASVAGITLLAQNGLYANAVIWGAVVGLKFYLGNILLTKSVFEQKETLKKNKLAKDCELIVQDVLKKHPINFK